MLKLTPFLLAFLFVVFSDLAHSASKRVKTRAKFYKKRNDTHRSIQRKNEEREKNRNSQSRSALHYYFSKKIETALQHYRAKDFEKAESAFRDLHEDPNLKIGGFKFKVWYYLARTLLKKEFINENERQEAYSYLKLAADGGDWRAMGFYGEMLYSGEVVEQNMEQARQYFEKVANEDRFLKSRYFLAVMMIKGEGGPRNLDKARYHMEQVVNMPEEYKGVYSDILARAHYYLGILFQKDKERSSDVLARKHLEKALSGGVSKARYNLALMLYYGSGGERDLKRALYLLEEILLETKDKTPFQAQILDFIGRCHYHLNAYKRAEDYLLKAISSFEEIRQPVKSTLWYFLGMSQIENKKDKEAIASFKKAMEGEPSSEIQTNITVALKERLQDSGALENKEASLKNEENPSSSDCRKAISENT